MKDFTLDDDFLRDFEDDIELAAEFVDAVSEWIESDEESKLFFSTVSLDCVFFRALLTRAVFLLQASILKSWMKIIFLWIKSISVLDRSEE